MSAVEIEVYDEVPGGPRSEPIRLTLASERITLRELIRRRVQREVERYNATLGERFEGLVQPTDAERTLNGYRMTRRKAVDGEAQFAKAIEAFGSNGFFVLYRDRQIEDLDELITLDGTSPISFLKLVPLVGG